MFSSLAVRLLGVYFPTVRLLGVNLLTVLALVDVHATLSTIDEAIEESMDSSPTDTTTTTATSTSTLTPESAEVSVCRSR